MAIDRKQYTVGTAINFIFEKTVESFSFFSFFTGTIFDERAKYFPFRTKCQ